MAGQGQGDAVARLSCGPARQNGKRMSVAVYIHYLEIPAAL